MTLPTGTVTFLFTDIEGSTRLARAHPQAWEAILAWHEALLCAAIKAHGGFAFQIVGDEICAAFQHPGEALKAALEAQNNLQAGYSAEVTLRVRMGIHTGEAEADGAVYRGYLALSLVQRLMSAGHGGQILLSGASEMLLRDSLPSGVNLRELGEHWLKDSPAPVPMFQVVAPGLPSEFPALRAQEVLPNNLPSQLTSFVGREQEIAELKQLLGKTHLLTLTGSGGTGKTRLSLQLAAQVMAAFPDGVWFLELAPISDPALIPNTLASLLGLRESGETKQPIPELLCGYLQTRKALLIFDNCEHLIEACAWLADLLLRSCKDLKILASSREALGVPGELAWHVPSLSLPDIKNLPQAEQLVQYEAVRLFIERASLVQPHFTLTKDNASAISQVCHRLDGIPLAIELAAARTNVLTVEQISTRLDDRFRLLTGGSRTALPRQQTLRALIDWSYNLLSEQERLLFRRLAVFIGGWTLEAAEAVCSDEHIDSLSILEHLSQLVRKSLVTVQAVDGQARYHRLETIRHYAREKLIETDEAAQLRDRHLDYFIQLAEQGYEGLRGPDDLTWVKRLEAEHDNFRTALSWALESPDLDPQKALQLSGALQDFWYAQGHISEGYQWLAEALKKAPNLPTSQRCRALNGAGELCRRLGRIEQARLHLESALALARQLDDPTQLILSLFYSSLALQNPVEYKERMSECQALARARGDQYHTAYAMTWGVFFYTDDEVAALRILAEALEIANRLGNARLRAKLLWVYSGKLLLRGSYDSLTDMAKEGLRLSQLLGDKHTAAHCLLILGRAASQQGHFDEAERLEKQSLSIFHDLSDPECHLRASFMLAWNDFLSGQCELAFGQIQECLSVSRSLGPHYLFMTSRYLLALGQIEVCRGNYKEASGFLLESWQSIDPKMDPVGLPMFLEGTCTLPSLPPERAARLLGKAQAIREKEGFVIPDSEQHLVEPVVKRLRAQLTSEAYDTASAAGAALTYEGAIQDAIETLGTITT